MKRFFRTSGGDGGVDTTCLRGAALTRPPCGCICHTQVRRTRSILARLPRLVTVFTDAVPDPPRTGAPESSYRRASSPSGGASCRYDEPTRCLNKHLRAV